MANTILIGVAAFVLGATAGFGVGELMRSSSDPGVAGASGESRNPADSRQGESKDVVAPSIAGSKEETPAGAPTRAPADESPSARAAVETAPLARPTGDGVIEGAVLDEKGVAIAGALVRATYSVERDEAERSRLGRAQNDRSLDDEIQQAREQYQKKRAVRVEATTDAAGHYALASLGDGYWSVTASADGYVLRSRGSAANLKPGATANFEGRAVAEVPVSILLPDGSSARRANISVTTDSPRSYETVLWTADDPVLRIVPGGHEIRAIVTRAQKAANGLEDEAASKKERVEFVAGQVPASIELRLEPRVGIRGIVYYGDGIELQQGCVAYLQVPQGRQVDLKQFDQAEPKNWIGQGDNRFEFLDLAPGSYAVGVLAGWNGPVLKHKVLELTKGVIECELDLRELDKKSFLSVKVSGPKNEPVGVSNFTYMYRSENNGMGGWVQPIEAEPGEYLIPPDDNITAWKKSDSPQSTLSLTVHSERFGDKTQTLNRADAQIVYKFGEVATLDVVVAGYVGSGMEGQADLELVRADAPRENMYYSNDPKLKGDGTAHFGPTEVGIYNLKVMSFSGNRWNRRAIATQKITLAAGENKTSINLPAIYNLTVTVVSDTGKEGSWVSLNGNEIYDNAQTKDGAVEFKNLPAGEYNVSCDINGLSAFASVKVPDQLQITLTPRESNAMRVYINKEDGYLAKVGIKNNDLIVGFDGADFASNQAMQSAFATLIGRPKVKVNVLRGSQRLEFEVDGARLMNPQEIGASWQPVAR